MATSSTPSNQLARQALRAASASGSLPPAWRTLRARDDLPDEELENDGSPQQHMEHTVVIVCSIIGSMVVVLIALAFCSCLVRRLNETRRRARFDRVDAEIGHTGGHLLPVTAANLARPPATHSRMTGSTNSDGTTMGTGSCNPKMGTGPCGGADSDHLPTCKEKVAYEHREYA
ncbi:hypothetical protein BD626DRAFT_473590 [Schizophyllum amplum]|uniref:Uncharacterized protein n=1 Tax=Schizophyllum amplum TaxID=97359 RepID=A0A550CWY1_9AGAR|nr:hypothetical protein BD626DRAFT_473590 [Auriculariopsis ampla]